MLSALSFSLPALKRIQSYLSNRLQRINNNDTYSNWSEILDLSQGLILDLLFDVFLDLFLIINNVNFASYTDDNTIYDFGDSILVTENFLQQKQTK